MVVGFWGLFIGYILMFFEDVFDMVVKFVVYEIF